MCCKRVAMRIECPTCGYSQAESKYTLEEVGAGDPGCRYEKDSVFVPDIGELETEDWSADEVPDLVRAVMDDDTYDALIEAVYSY